MITQALFRALDRKAIWLVAILLLVAIAVPASNLLLPEGNPFRLPNYAVPLFGNRDLSKAAASILGDEAMHWAVLRQAVGENPVPSAFVS